MAHRRPPGLAALCAPLACALLAGTAHADEPIVEIEGDLPRELRELVVSTLEIVEQPARSRAQGRRRLERSATAVREVLRSEGYYDADIQGSLRETARSDPEAPARLQPVLTLSPGPQYVIGEAEVAFETEIAEGEEARAQLDLPSGSPAKAARVVAAGLRVTNWLEQHGYPEASNGDRRVVVDHDDDDLNVTYPIAPGPRVRFGEVRLTGDAKIGPGWVRMVTPFESGDIFDERELDRLTSHVVGTGVFAQAVSTLEEGGVENADGTITRNVILNVTQGDKNTVSGAVGYSTTEGSGVEAIYERRNFIGYAQTLTLRAVAKTNEISLGATYDIPYFYRVDRQFTGDVEVAREDTEAFDGERATARALVGQVVNERLRVGVGAGVEASQFTQNEIEREAYVADVLGRAVYDARDNRLSPTKGFLLTLDATPSYNFGDESAFFTRAKVGGSAYHRVSDQFVLAGRLEAGSTFGTDLDNIPFNRRFYAGGGGSVRGFAYQSIGPQDEFGEATGGRSLVAGAAEVRWRSPTLLGGNIGAAAFVDAATVAVPEIADFREIRYGAGVGVRYYTPFAPLRADIAIPLNPRDGDEDFQIYISIGQAF